MRLSLTLSILMHVAILAAAFVVLPNPDEFEVKPQDSIPIDIVTDAMLGKRMAMVKDAEPAKPADKVAPKKSDPVKPVEPQPEIDDKIKVAAKEQSAPDPVKEKPKEEPPPKPAEKPPEAKPEPKKAEAKPLDPDPLKDLIKTTDEAAELQAKLEEEKKAEEKKLAEEKAKAEEQKKLEEKKKAEAEAKKKKDEEKKKLAEQAKAEAKKKKKELNLDEIAALLDNTNDKRAAPQKPSVETGSPKKGEVNIQGTDDSLSATLADLLNKRFAECWNVPPAVQGSKLSVEVQFQLNKDGTVSAMPRVLNAQADPVFAAMAQSAVSAVQGCGPYDFLPAEHYDLWQDVVVDFNPSKMFGT